MVAAWHLDYLVKTNMVDLASLLPLDPIDYRDELAVVAPPAFLLGFSSLIAVLILIHGFGLSLTIVLAGDCTDGLLAGGVACHEVEQLPCRPRFATSELVDECLIGCAGDECYNHVRVHDIEVLIALLGEAVDVLA